MNRFRATGRCRYRLLPSTEYRLTNVSLYSIDVSIGIIVMSAVVGRSPFDQCFPKFERWRVKKRAEIDERVNSGSHPEIPICLLETYLATGGGGGCKSRFFAWRVNFTRHIKCWAGKILEAAGKLLLAGSTLGSAALELYELLDGP